MACVLHNLDNYLLTYLEYGSSRNSSRIVFDAACQKFSPVIFHLLSRRENVFIFPTLQSLI